MSLNAPKLQATIKGQSILVPITQTSGNTLAGLQFELHYDPAALSYVEFSPSSVNPTINPTEPGIFRFIVYDLAGLPESLGTITFVVNGSSQLVFVNVLASDSTGKEWTDSNNNKILTNDGLITLEGDTMNVGFTWTNPNPAGRVLSWTFYESTDGGANFSAVMTGIPAGDTRLDYDVLADTGEHQFYLVGVGQFGTSPPSNVLTLDSAVPLPPTLAFE